MRRITVNDSKAWGWILVCLVAAGVALAQEGTPGFRVIVHADNSTPTATRADVSRLMLKKSTRWDDGTDAYPVDLAPGSPVREAFTELVHGRSTEIILSYWQRQVFSGRAMPPPTVGSDEEVVAYVRSHRGGIGYVSPAIRLEGVRELTVVDR